MEKLFKELKSGMEFLSAVEKKIAREILDDPKKFTTYSLGELSEKLGVSQGSVINFAGKFVGGGFPALKMAVAMGANGYLSLSKEQTGEASGVKKLYSTAVNNVVAALKNTAALNGEEVMDRVAARILSARKVEIYGVFRSAVVATDFYYQLLQIGIPASFVSDVLTCEVSAAMLKEDCLFIAISSSGKTKDVIDAVKIAKGNGVPIVSFTSNKNSPLAKLSDDVLLSAPSGNGGNDGTEVRTSQLVLADAFCLYLREKKGDAQYAKMASILNSHNVME